MLSPNCLFFFKSKKMYSYASYDCFCFLPIVFILFDMQSLYWSKCLKHQNKILLEIVNIFYFTLLLKTVHSLLLLCFVMTGSDVKAFIVVDEWESMTYSILLRILLFYPEPGGTTFYTCVRRHLLSNRTLGRKI